MKRTIFMLMMLISVFTESFANNQESFVLSTSIFPPFISKENGEAKGIYVDVLREALENRMNIPVEFKFLPWKRAQAEVKSGETDAMITLPNELRLSYSVEVKPAVAKGTMGAFTYENHPRLLEMKKIENLSDLKKYKLLTYLGDGWAKNTLQGYNIDMSAPDLEKTLRKLSQKRGDLFIQTKEVVNYNLKKIKGVKVTEVPGVVFSELNYKLLISRKSDFIDLINEIDKVLLEMHNDGTMQKIYDNI